MRAVLDPNVLIAVALSPTGTPAKIHLAWLAGEFDLVISPELIKELQRAFGYPHIRKRVPREEADEFIEVLRREASMVEDSTRPPSVRSSDPGDDYLLALAEVEAAAVVSGDSDVLEVNGGLPIYSPREFLEFLESRRRE